MINNELSAHPDEEAIIRLTGNNIDSKARLGGKALVVKWKVAVCATSAREKEGA